MREVVPVPIISLLVNCLCGCGGAVPEEVSGVAPPDQTVVAGELIILANPGASETDVEELSESAGAEIRGTAKDLAAYLIGFQPDLRDGVRESLLASPLIEDVLDNRWLTAEAHPDDSLYDRQWHFAAINAPSAWSASTGSEEHLIAVLDSGVDVEHVDLSERIRSGGDTFRGGSAWDDLHGHGTSVAGILGSDSHNREGVAAVSWRNPVLPIRVTDEQGRATSWSIASGIGLAVKEGAKVINISFAPLHDSTIVLRHARLAWLSGSLVVVAAGNSGLEVEEGGSKWALFVAATDDGDELALFSTRGSFVDLVAPGMAIYTTRLGGGYAPVSGTSFSAPLVSGVAALIWSVNPSLSPATVKSILLTSARDLGAKGKDDRYGAGLVDAGAALQKTSDVLERSDETAPETAITEPDNGARLAESTLVKVSASDDTDVAEVVLLLDDTPLGSDLFPPHHFILNPVNYEEGEHILEARVTDTSGNSASHSISVSFAGSTDSIPPTVEILSPSAGAQVRGTVTLLAKATDNSRLDSAEVLLDGEVIDVIPVLTGTESQIAYNWSPSKQAVDSGSHVLAVRVFDRAGNSMDAGVRVDVKY
jgi:subtilisin family serine protease